MKVNFVKCEVRCFNPVSHILDYQFVMDMMDIPAEDLMARIRMQEIDVPCNGYLRVFTPVGNTRYLKSFVVTP